MFVEIVENGKGISDADKLLICLAIILLLTIVWTILIGIMCRMRNQSTTIKKTNKFLLDDDDDDEVAIASTKTRVASTKSSSKYTAKRAKKTTKKTTKKTKKTTRKSSTRNASRTSGVVKANSDQEVYVKVKFYGTTKNLIYVAPENIILRKGERIKVRTDEGNIRTATVTEGNYLREKYKTYEYQTLDVVE